MFSSPLPLSVLLQTFWTLNHKETTTLSIPHRSNPDYIITITVNSAEDLSAVCSSVCTEPQAAVSSFNTHQFWLRLPTITITWMWVSHADCVCVCVFCLFDIFKVKFNEYWSWMQCSGLKENNGLLSNVWDNCLSQLEKKPCVSESWQREAVKWRGTGWGEESCMRQHWTERSRTLTDV